jgi:hypothetical protein
MRVVVIVKREGDLLEVVHALHAMGRFPRPLDGWDEQSNQGANDGDHDEQLDECQGTT